MRPELDSQHFTCHSWPRTRNWASRSLIWLRLSCLISYVKYPSTNICGVSFNIAHLSGVVWIKPHITTYLNYLSANRLSLVISKYGNHKSYPAVRSNKLLGCDYRYNNTLLPWNDKYRDKLLILPNNEPSLLAVRQSASWKDVPSWSYRNNFYQDKSQESGS